MSRYLLLVSLLLTACGQSGALYMPADPPAPAPAGSAPAPTEPAESEESEEREPKKVAP